MRMWDDGVELISRQFPVSPFREDHVRILTNEVEVKTQNQKQTKQPTIPATVEPLFVCAPVCSLGLVLSPSLLSLLLAAFVLIPTEIHSH